MSTWTMYPAFLASVTSVFGLTAIAYREHDRARPATLSALAVSSRPLLTRFRLILFLCGSLFAVTMYCFIIPGISLSAACLAAWTLTYANELLLAIFPARDRTYLLHLVCAKLMALGMLLLAYIFWLSLSGGYQQLELAVAVVMSALVILTFTDKRRFLFYELSFIFLSHVSMLLAAVAIAGR